ncbi:MAG: hypothetical protein ACREFD_16575 [Stellaceae bacterium]
MKANYFFRSLAILGGVAMAVPAFAQSGLDNGPNANEPSRSQMTVPTGPNSGMSHSNMSRNAVNVPTGPGPGQMGSHYRASTAMAPAAGAMSQQQQYHRRRHHYAVEFSPGGGHYTRRDVAAEPPGRMSHPGVGAMKALSYVTKSRSESVMDRVENRITERLNDQQLKRAGRVAQAASGQHEQASLPTDTE